MSHLDPDTLTLLAFGEESEGAGGHLADCGTCAADLALLRRTVAAGRAIDRSERVPAPPALVWDRIAEELALDARPAPAPAHGRNGDGPSGTNHTAALQAPAAEPTTAEQQAHAAESPTAKPPAPVAESPTAEPPVPVAESPTAEPPAAEPAASLATAPAAADATAAAVAPSAAPITDAPTPDAPPSMPAIAESVARGGGATPLAGPAAAAAPSAPGDTRPPSGPRSRARASKRRRTSLIMGGLVGLAILATVATVGLSSARPRVVAEAALAPLGGSSVEGSAQLVERDGALELRVDLDAAAADPDRYYELWLLDDSGDRLVSLGPVAGGGVHPLPAGLTVADFPVVDVSSERFDGDPSHSGDSLSRGTLPV